MPGLIPWHPLDHWGDHQHRRPPPCSTAPPIEQLEGLHPWNEHPARLKDETPPPWIIRTTTRRPSMMPPAFLVNHPRPRMEHRRPPACAYIYIIRGSPHG